MDDTELHRRLLADVRSYDPAVHIRGLLGPYRDVVLLQRAKFMSYEQIAATFVRHGLRISPAAVGAFCRRAFTKAELDRARRVFSDPKEPIVTMTLPPIGAPAFGASAPGAANPAQGMRGPKIARDNY